MRAALAEAGLEIEIDSAGTAAYHIGDPPDPRAVATAQRHGIDISDLRGRQLADDDFDRFTHIVALDKANLTAITSRVPRHSDVEIMLLLDATENHKGEAVPDPYYGDDEGFEVCWQTIKAGIDALVVKLANP